MQTKTKTKEPLFSVLAVGGLLLGMLPLTVAFAQEAAPTQNAPVQTSPAVAKLSTAITFYAAFDGQPVADLSGGKGAPTGNFQTLEWVDGKYNRALRAKKNAVIYDAADNVNFENSGALAVWVALGERVDSAAPVQLGFATIRYRGSSFALARQGGIKNGEAIIALVGSNINAATSRAFVSSGSSKTWKSGEWHLLAVNWGSDYIELSLDGGLFKRTTVNYPLFNHTEEAGTMSIASSGGADSPYDLDDLFIFNRPLTAEEAALIYNAAPDAVAAPIEPKTPR